MANKGQFVKGQIPWNKKEHIRIVCETCNSNFTVVPSRFIRAKYCSISCIRKGKPSPNKGIPMSEEVKAKLRASANRNRGPAHFNWRPWTKQSHRDRVHFRNTMQHKIFARDCYKCTDCSLGGDLQVHHIRKWSKYPELRFDPNNCTTLCSSCHYKITFNREMPDQVGTWGHNMTRKEIS